MTNTTAALFTVRAGGVLTFTDVAVSGSDLINGGELNNAGGQINVGTAGAGPPLPM